MVQNIIVVCVRVFGGLSEQTTLANDLREPAGKMNDPLFEAQGIFALDGSAVQLRSATYSIRSFSAAYLL